MATLTMATLTMATLTLTTLTLTKAANYGYTYHTLTMAKHTCYGAVSCCQHYGEAKREGAPQAADVELLLRLLPGLKVAFLERRTAAEVAAETVAESGGGGGDGGGGSGGGEGGGGGGGGGEGGGGGGGSGGGGEGGGGGGGGGGAAAAGGGAGTEEFAAVLVTSDGAGGLSELGRVALPGMPILGEGKPENQNLGLTFTRGTKLMVVDMNQDGYFEEALKVRYPTPYPYYPSPSPQS